MNMNCKVLLTLTTLATFCCQAAGKLIMKPGDTVVQVNNSTYFNCSTDIGSTAIFWFHREKYIFTGNAILEPFHERFMVDRIEGNGTYIYNLVIHSVQPDDAGEYICAEDEGFREKCSVQLIVLDDDPTCRSYGERDEIVGQNTCNMEPDEVVLDCSVTYHGNIPPQLEWRRAIGNSSTPLENVSTVVSKNHIVSTLKLKGDIALNNSSYICETKRTLESIKCYSEVIKISYALSDNTTVNTTLGDEIYCIANTSQPCSYKWKWLQDNDFTIESSTSVLKAQKLGWHRCEAECSLRNTTCNLLVMRAMIYGETSITRSSQAKTIIISVVVTVILTLVSAFVAIILAILICDRQDERRNRAKATLAAAKNEQSPNGCQPSESESVPLVKLPNKSPSDTPIRGLAVLKLDVFIVRLEHQDIEVYDSTTFDFKRRMTVNGMTYPQNIVSCSVENCLYASDYGYNDTLPAILRIDPVNGNLVNSWDLYGKGGLLSIASDTHVILITNDARLYEYTADGQLIRKIRLFIGGSMPFSFFDYWHAVKLPNGLFVVGNGKYSELEINVYLLSIKETTTMDKFDKVEILETYVAEKEKPRRISETQVYLSVSEEGLILLSSESSNRAVLLNFDLKEMQILVSKEDGMESHVATCFDQSTGKWLLAGSRCVVVCRVNDDGVERNRHDIISKA